jgi:hypothetical protein
LHILLKRKIQITVFPLARSCTVAIGTFAILPAYKLKTHILITVGRDTGSVPPLGFAIPVISSNPKTQINAKIVMLKYRFRIQDVVTFLKLAMIHPDLDANKAAF